MYNSLRNVHIIQIPRWIETSGDSLFFEIHGFSDSSMLAYSAAVYARVCSSTKEMACRLICAKTKVAPVKQLSIPRLELCGAHLLVRLTSHVTRALHLTDVPIHLWSDSKNVLFWIRAHSSTWKTFVANRVSYIQTALPNTFWHHIEGVDNPADCATRGLSPEQLAQHDLWWFGPHRLTLSNEPWSEDHHSPEPTELLEQNVVAHQTTIPTKDEGAWDLFFPYASSFLKLLRITAWCKRWLFSLTRFRNAIVNKLVQLPKNLTPTEINNARLLWISTVQKTAYRPEIETLSRPKPTLPKKTSLMRLNPYLDESNLLRVGGRLKHSIPDPDEKHPLILPRKSPLTDLVIDHCHRRVLHGGTQLTLATLRRQYWITQGRQAVKSRISNCMTCVRYRASTAVQQMANLPADCVQPKRAFLNTGVDYCGPSPIRTSSGRGRQSKKGYISVSVCLTTRAVNLEAVSEYTTAKFLSAFNRFSGRRGFPLTMRSDCATNFVGADSELRKLFSSASKFSTTVAETLANDGTTWLFNPPSAPHQGGLWEAAVKSVKFHLKRVIGDATLTYEEISTLLIQIEACLNSRPLQALSDDPEDLSALTPGYFLIGTALTTVPEPSLLEININRLTRWSLVQRMYQDFWLRWSKEYLHSLQALPKWQRPKSSVRVGDLAVLKNETLPPSKWPLCRIVDIHPGDDGLVRVVKVRTASSVYKRPITKLCLLPTHDNNYRPLVE
ncbi:uncharacterized protein LOC127286374 [Leptopilina boulardi]|uniref:uncharacterized protein LOC127286374 n=1 Tax=Leptopilina boulardi TaxID=63433 RepID=UPI0021F66A62|nr:uncharacterized protein LOC127286374 [Leptopilina boulardi]